MLAGLDVVPWAEFEVAGVSDVPIPDLLLTMAAGDEHAAIDAFRDLQWEILHQGSVYSATAPVVPFLAELLTGVGPTLRAGIVELLGDLAHAYEIDPEEPPRVEVRAAVTAEVDRLLGLLAHDDPWTRYVAAYALSGCPDRAEDILEGLRRRFDVETEPRVRAGVVMAAAELDRRTPLVSEGLAARQAPVVRAAAVLAVVRTGRRWPGAKAVAAVQAAWRDGDPFAGGDGDGRWGPPDWYPEAMKDLLDNLAPADQVLIITALLSSADPDVRMRAAVHAGTAIGVWRSLREPLAAVLVPSLRDDDPRVRLAAADAIRRAGPAAAHHADALAVAAGRDDEAGGQAVAALAELGDRRAGDRLPAHLRAGTGADDLGIVLAATGAPATPELLDAVRHRLAALAGNAPEDRDIEVIRDIRRQGRHTDPEPLGLLRLVQAWGPAAAPAVGELVSLLRSGRAGPEAANALAAIGPAAAHALPQLPAHEPIGDSAEHNEKLLAMARARWRLTGDPRPAIEEAWLHITHEGADIPAVALLTEVGEPARDLLPRMREARADWLTEIPEWYQSERVAVARLIWEWTGDPDEALPVARQFLDDLDPDLIAYGEVEAAILAVDLGQADAVPTLTDMLADDDRPFGQLLRAYRALWRLTGDPDLVLAPLTRLVTAEKPPGAESWTDLLQLITEIGPAAAPILPTLREIAERDEHTVTFWPGQTPGFVDEQIRTAIRETATTVAALAR